MIPPLLAAKLSGKEMAKLLGSKDGDIVIDNSPAVLQAAPAEVGVRRPEVTSQGRKR